jgi:hypothetical protein
MTHFSVVKANTNDYARVLPLLKGFHTSRFISDATWKNLFTRDWSAKEQYCGRILLADEKPAGFIHSLFSDRKINEKEVIVCNLGTWIVEEEYRRKSLMLFFPYMEMKDITFTSFTANPKYTPILQRFNFQSLEKTVYFIPPYPSISKSIPLINDPQVIQNCLDGDVLKIFLDHKDLHCIHLLVQSSNAQCYLNISMTRKKRLPVAFIHFVSDVDLFLSTIQQTASSVCRLLHASAIMVGEHTLHGVKPRLSLAVPRRFQLWFRSTNLNAYDVDTLYSEYQVLGLAPV